MYSIKKIGFIVSCLCFSSTVFSQVKSPKQQQKFSTTNKKITVYTTAETSNLKLTATDNLVFSSAKQPLETETSIFVEPSKKFQKFIGIGGAVTDASAEAFAKLSK